MMKFVKMKEELCILYMNQLKFKLKCFRRTILRLYLTVILETVSSRVSDIETSV